jgi:hypothetical protein
MNLRIILTGILIMFLLCCFLTGCQKEVSGSTQTKDITVNSDVTVNPTVTEACQLDSEGSNVEADSAIDKSETGDDAMNTKISWKQIKEIIPSEKKLKNRYAGFLNDKFGISTYQYGRLSYTVDGGETWTSSISALNKSESLRIRGFQIFIHFQLFH